MKIIFQKGKRAGESLTFEPPGAFIGREEDNDIQLLIDGVSQYHAKILFEKGKWVLHDLKSSNGTRINNSKKVKEPTPLKSGDLIYIAKEALRIEFEEEKKEEKPDSDKDDAVKIRSPEEAKKTLPPIEEPKKTVAEKPKTGALPKESKEQKAQKREVNRLIQEALKEKRKRLTIISIIIAIIANGIVFWWWYSKWRS